MTQSRSFVQLPSIKISSSYMAPWVLAREPILMHLLGFDDRIQSEFENALKAKWWPLLARQRI